MSKINLTLLSSALAAAVAVAGSTRKLYDYAADLIVAAETSYSTALNTGATKKAAVMAAVKAAAEQLGIEWAAIEAEMSAWIDYVKAAYNAAHKLFAGDFPDNAATS